MAQTVIGFFDDASEAQTAVQRLQSRGIAQDRIDVSRGSGGSGSSMGSGNLDTNPVSGSAKDENSVSRTSDGRTVDAAGRNTNAITDFFNNLFGGHKEDAERYSKVAHNSNTIVTVHAQSREEADSAADILDEAGAVDVDERSAQYGYSNTRSTEGLSEIANVSGDRNLSGERDQTIERIEENLEVGKRTVEKGGVRVRSRIVERPVEEHVRLREEHVHVERNPVDRPLTGDALNRFGEQDMELRESAEVPVVNKEARVVEEVRVSKDVTERDETIRDNVRHTEIDVDNTGSGNTGTTNRSSFGTDEDYDDDTRSNRGL